VKEEKQEVDVLQEYVSKLWALFH